MSSTNQNTNLYSAARLFIALLVISLMSLSLTSEVFADHCEDTCHSESSESSENGEDSQECDACLCCLHLVKIFVPTEFDPLELYCPESDAGCVASHNNFATPPVEIDHPPQNLL